MKKQKFHLHKFSKKYLFLQNSLFDFLYWRSVSSNSRNTQSLRQINSQNLEQIQNSFPPLSQDKICLSEYWKSSDTKKIDHVFQNLNKTIPNLQRPSKFEKSSVFIPSVSNDWEKIKRKKEKNSSSFSNKKTTPFFLLKQKINKRHQSDFNHLKSRTFQTHRPVEKQFQDFEFLAPFFCFFSSFFLPVSQLKEHFKKHDAQNTTTSRLGEFFPKKKNFQQYWVFPLFSFAIVFCTNSSFFSRPFGRNFQQENWKLNKAPFFLQNVQVERKKSNQPVSSQNSIAPFDFSYGTSKFKTYSKTFQNLEKNEFEQFSKFYSKILESTFVSFPDVQTIPLDTGKAQSFVSNDFKYFLERKRNTFAWKWFSLQSTGLNEHDHQFSVLTPQIPQKAHFFQKNRNFENIPRVTNSTSESGTKKFTPLFDFSRSISIFDEVQKILPVFEKKSVTFSETSFKPRDISEFLQNSKKNEVLFLNSLATKKLNPSEKKFLTNWFQTTNAFVFQMKNESTNVPRFEFSNILFSMSEHSKLKTQKNSETTFFISQDSSRKNPKATKATTLRNFFVDNAKLLDFLYFQKVYKIGNSKMSSKPTVSFSTVSSEIESLFSFEQKKEKNEIQTVFRTKQKKNFVQNSKKNFKQKKFPFASFWKYDTKRKNFFLLKKQTFQVYITQWFKTKANFQKKETFSLSPLPFSKIQTDFKTNQKVNQTFENSSKYECLNVSSLKHQKNLLTDDFDFQLFSEGSRRRFKNSFQKIPSVTRLESPIFCDFSNVQTSFQKHNKQTFLKFFSKDQIPFFYDLKYQQSNLSSNFFKVFTDQKKKNVQFQKREQEKEEKSIQSIFSFSKFSCFENLFQKILKNLRVHSFSSLLSSDFFQKHFFFEKNDKYQALFFENHKSLLTSFEKFKIPHANFLFFKKQKNSLKIKNPKSFLLKFQTKQPFSNSFLEMQPQIMNEKHSIHSFSFKNQKKSNKKYRKFEKVFQTFFSPLNTQTYSLSANLDKMSKSSKIETSKEKTLQSGKYQKDKFFLKTFSKFISEQFEPSPFRFLYSIKREQEKQIQFQKIEKLKTPRKKECQAFFSFSPEFLLKRDGFVFFNSFQKSIHNISFQKKESTPFIQKISRSGERSTRFADNTHSQTFKRLEKEKSFQKKRRLKKQKLETRRRKKRKRFYPRPVWLRFHLYQKFLKTRHPSLHSFSSHKITTEKKNQKFHKIFVLSPTSPELFFHHFQGHNQKSKQSRKRYKIQQKNEFFFKPSMNFQKRKYTTLFVKNLNLTNSNKFYQKNAKKWGIYWKGGLHKPTLYEKFPLLFNVGSKSPFFSFSNQKGIGLFVPESEKTENEKNGILTMNSSIFQTNFISNNREQYKISADVLSEFLRLSWKSYWFQTQYQPYTYKIKQNFQTMQKIESQKNFDVFNFLGPLKYSFFLNNFSFVEKYFDQNLILKKSIFQKFLWYSNIRNSYEFNPIEKNFLPFQHSQNIPEYNRILYDRVSELVRNFKFSENTEEFSLKNLKIPKRKDETIFSNSSLFTKSALFFEKFQIPSQPTIPAFSLFSSLFHDSSIKPTGELPTLRSLWAYQKTNVFHFQETNCIRNLWTLKKRTANFKSFKATKKVVNFLRKYGEIEKFNTSFLQQTREMNFAGKKVQNFLAEQTSFANRNFQEKGTNFDFFNFFSFEMKKIQGDKRKFLNQLDALSLQKFRNIEKKCSMFGIRSLKQNSKLSLRYLKFHLLENSSKKDFVISALVKKMEKNSNDFSKNEESLKNTQDTFLIQKKNFQSSPKSSLNFWWSQKSFQSFDWFLTSQALSLDSSRFFSLGFENQKKSAGSMQSFSSFESQLIFFSTFLFHLAIFGTLLKIPEIRSALKFQCLLFYKFFNCFFSILFSIHSLFKQYIDQSFVIFEKISRSRNTKNSFSSGSTLFFRENFLSNSNFQKYCFLTFQKKRKLKTTSKNSKDFLYEILLRFPILPSGSLNFHSSFLFSNVKTKNQRQPIKKSFGKNSKVYLSKQFSQNSTPNQLSYDSSLFPFSKHFKFSFQKQNFFENFKPTKFENLFSFFTISLSPPQRTLQKQKKSVFVSPKFSIFQYFFKNSSSNGSQSQNIQRFSQKNQKISKTEKLAFEVALTILLFGKSTTILSYSVLQGGSLVSSKVFEGIETILFSLYKFLEKPAELMIEWIALIFLLEWSSDIATFVPDTLDSSIWKSSQKLIRPFRSGSILFHIVYSQQLGPSPVINGMNAVGLFTSSNLLTFLLQKRMWYCLENFSSLVIEPDIDILIRQKKGMIFWDIWAEILLKAAEKYNVNIPSFVTLKEEQELFLEKLLQDHEFLNTLQVDQSQKSLASYLQNFLIVDRPTKFLDSRFLSLQSPLPFSVLFSFESFSKRKKTQTTKQSKKRIHQLALAHSINSFLRNPTGKSQKKTLNTVLSANFVQKFETPFAKYSIQDRWSCNQYGTYQGQETDLFLDIHPSKSLKHIQFLKYYEPAQYTLGSLMCQVYSGLFPKQVSKNILVIGSPGTAKTLFIQALAGETEMKIIADNAYRYSMVQRGVAVGMKYLRDVFDAIALQTPCFFLLEHIHVIGSKRPLLLSDDENVKGNQSSFGLEQQEVHETNQMIYQLSRHSISDFKRPYKGDFSMCIPTNFFLENFYSKLEKNSVSIFQNSQFSGKNFSSHFRSFLQSPLPIDSIESSLFQQGFAEKEGADTMFQSSVFDKTRKKIQTCLQFSKEQIFAPPATSPFTVLMMKEQKKLKPKKIVQEISWGGLSADQIVSYQKETYSIRAKVAALADITMNLSRGKLDMITDLLVIIDSVRSNRGFVVFGTTHLPSLLDPALRRPGRFDETLWLAQSPNFFNRFEIFKIHLENSVSTFDFLDSSIVTENFSELDLLALINETKLSFFHQYKYTQNTPLNSQLKKNTKQKNQFRTFSQLSPRKAFQTFLKSSFFTDFYTVQSFKKQHSFFPTNSFTLEDSLNSNVSLKDTLGAEPQESTLFFESDKTKQRMNSLIRNSDLHHYSILPKGPSHLLTLAYSQIGIFLGKSNFLKDPQSFVPLTLDRKNFFFQENFQQFITNSLYTSTKYQKIQLMVFLSGKITEFFVQKNVRIFDFFFLKEKKQQNTKKQQTNKQRTAIFETPKSLFSKKFSLFMPMNKILVVSKTNTKLSKEMHSMSQNFLKNENQKNSSSLKDFAPFSNTNLFTMPVKNDFFWTTFGNDESWRSATPFLFSIVQKRFLFTKNLLLSKMLFFDNNNQRKQPPSPPNSSILMPSKKYENFKRTENDFLQKARFSINEKIQMHQKQRFLKQLYNIPVQKYFRSEIVQKRQTFFSSSFQELAYLDSLTRRSSSSHFYLRKYIGLRHSFSHINQWWNGMLPEHNPETTYLSDVDWRTLFISTKQQTLKKNFKTHFDSIQNFKQSEKNQNQTLEFTMDFPDAEQYYNPRNRRWYLNTTRSIHSSGKNSNYWLTFDLDLQYEIYYHFLMQSFHKSFEYFDTQREMLDFFVFHLLNKGFLKELDVLTTFSRFHRN